MNRLSSLKHMQHLMHIIIIKKKMKRKKRKKKIFSLHVFVNIQYYETLTRFNTRTIYIEYGYNSKIFVTVLCCYFNSRYASRGGGRVRTPALFRYNSNCAIKFLDQFRRNALKNQFKKRKNPSKRCTNKFS